MAIRVRHGTVVTRGSNTANVTFGGFSGTPSVTATVVGSEKNGATVCILKRSNSGSTFAAFYNGVLELKDFTIDWIAVGHTSEVKICGCVPSGHRCLADVYE